MDLFLDFINQNIAYAPYAICGLLLLAGLNLPVSEDLMIFTSAFLAVKNPEYSYQLFAGLFIGGYVSALISYAFLGRYLGDRLRSISFFSKMVSDERIEQISRYYEKYGFFTLLIGRFIPFGVRNALFITAGMSKMNAFKFAIGDLIACTTSISTFFYIYYTYGEQALEIVKKGNYIVFALFIAAALALYIRKKRRK